MDSEWNATENVAFVAGKYMREGGIFMQRSRWLTTSVAVGALLATLNLGCAARRPTAPQITDTWTAAAERASTAAGQAEAAASRAEAAAARVEAAAQRAEDAASRVEAMVTKTMRK